jgi:GTP-binding protein Era
VFSAAALWLPHTGNRLTLMATKAGFVTLVGRPNAGKSTLLNKLVGERLAIVSPKPQSTRERVVGILSDESSQLIFLDTPGLLEPRYALHRAMLHAAHKAIEDADVIVYLVDAARDIPEDLMALAQLPRPPRVPIIHVLNKADTLGAERRAELAEKVPHGRFISATTGEGLDALLADVRDRLPDSPFLYDKDDVSTQQMRFFVAEFLRETVLEQLDDEVPYGVAVGIDEYREDDNPVYIRAVLYVERDSQKRILIGAGGSRIKQIGQSARSRIEPLVGRPVYLDLWVKELKNWRKDLNALARLGYRLPEVDTR